MFPAITAYKNLVNSKIIFINLKNISVFKSLQFRKSFLQMRKISRKLVKVIKSLISITKKDSTSGIYPAGLLSTFLELCSIVDIITLSDEASYRYQKGDNFFHFSTSSDNSPEYATNDRK